MSFKKNISKKADHASSASNAVAAAAAAPAPAAHVAVPVPEPVKAESQAINIDGKEYHLDDLSAAAKQQLASLRATDIEIARHEALLAMLKTARLAYARAARQELDK